ncbi:hypothetical protein GCM10022223_62410 [Kineosporia mesophila]|uniref:Uncharacterized protein n=1 Tax=Kineosporia mesophila TaxID=566012 RepID=A0ABP7AME4_9ACTN|nr:hypothetical protein [Kineosporia mesophila]MCD5354506.1 hypothetical protein [Kineosporia mesophila]
MLHLTEDRLAPGAAVIADDTSFGTAAACLSHVENPANGYVRVNLPVAEGMSISSGAA